MAKNESKVFLAHQPQTESFLIYAKVATNEPKLEFEKQCDWLPHKPQSLEKGLNETRVGDSGIGYTTNYLSINHSEKGVTREEQQLPTRTAVLQKKEQGKPLR